MNPDHPLKNLGKSQARSIFTNIPVEFVVPKSCPVVFINDLFVDEYKGGAELTSQALISKAPVPVFRVHSSSLTIEMLDRYKDKYWILGNFTQANSGALSHLALGGFKYAIVEYDYKYCSFRSEVLHQKQTGHVCDCPLRPHGILIEKLYGNAQKIFWMSEKQKEQFLTRIPSLFFAREDQHVIQSSVFSDEAIDLMVSLRELHKTETAKFPIKIWAVQGSKNWIKGTKETVEACSKAKMPVKILSDLQPEEFLKELAKCSGLAFQPLDFDTCPRIVIEAKLMGLELVLNDNVQHKDESWFSGTLENLENYLRTRGSNFWNHIIL